MTVEADIAREFFENLMLSDRSGPETLARHQSRLLERLLRHAVETVPFYSGLPLPKTQLSADSEEWLRLPLLSRADLTGHRAELSTRSFPRLHGQVTTAFTGGSTGIAARRDLSSAEMLTRFAVSYRMFEAWNLDQSRDLFWLRKTRPRQQPRYPHWGMPWHPPETLGLRHAIDITTPPAEQLAALAARVPAYVNTLPSNLMRLGLAAESTGQRMAVPNVITVGEYLGPEVRSLAVDVFGSRCIDVYSSAEGGVIAIQCPESGLYHIQSEIVLAELLGPGGEPCRPGDVGEIVVTPLYGYATPLLRYRSGDFAEKGPACPCGRPHPTISRFVGRREHMFRFPDGSTALPAISRVAVTRVLGHENWVLSQVSGTLAELQLAGACEKAQAESALAHCAAALDGRFSVRIREVETLPLTTGGKRHFTRNDWRLEG